MHVEISIRMGIRLCCVWGPDRVFLVWYGLRVRIFDKLADWHRFVWKMEWESVIITQFRRIIIFLAVCKVLQTNADSWIIHWNRMMTFYWLCFVVWRRYIFIELLSVSEVSWFIINKPPDIFLSHKVGYVRICDIALVAYHSNQRRILLWCIEVIEISAVKRVKPLRS